MLSQSLLFALCRETAAPPDSSASSQAETTPGSRPVSAASRAANVRWSEVSIVEAAAGKVVGPLAAVEPTALESSVLKLGLPEIALEDAPTVEGVPAVVVVEAAAGGENTVCRLASCSWIWPIWASTEEIWLRASV